MVGSGLRFAWWPEALYTGQLYWVLSVSTAVYAATASVSRYAVSVTMYLPGYTVTPFPNVAEVVNISVKLSLSTLFLNGHQANFL